MLKTRSLLSCLLFLGVSIFTLTTEATVWKYNKSKFVSPDKKVLSPKDIRTLLNYKEGALLLPDLQMACFAKKIFKDDGVWEEKGGVRKSLGSVFTSDKLKNFQCQDAQGNLASFTLSKYDKDQIKVRGMIFDRKGETYISDKKKQSSKEGTEFFKTDPTGLEEFLRQFSCEFEVEFQTKKEERKKYQPARAQTLRLADIAVEADFAFYSLFCEEPHSEECAEEVALDIGNLFATANVIYNRDLQVSLRMSWLKIWNEEDPWAPIRENLLRAIRAYWEDPNNRRTDISRAAVLFLDGKLSSGGTSVSGLCNRGAYSRVSLERPENFARQDKAASRARNSGLLHLVAHELGHNLGAVHDHNGKPTNNCFMSEPPDCTELPINCCGLTDERQRRCRELLYGDSAEDRQVGDHQGDIMSYCDKRTLEFYPRAQAHIQRNLENKEDCLSTLENHPPSISQVRTSVVQHEEGAVWNPQIEVTASDLDGDPLYYVFTWENKGRLLAVNGIGEIDSGTGDPLDVTITVFDPWGLASSNQVVQVNTQQRNQRPFIDAIHFPDRVNAGERLDVFISVIERDREEVEVEWDWGDGARHIDPHVPANVAARGLENWHIYERAGDYSVAVRVRDPQGVRWDGEWQGIIRVNPPLSP